MEIFFKNLTPEEGTAEKLLLDLRILKEDTEELFRATGGKLAEKTREKFLTSVEKARAACHDLQDISAHTARATGHALHEYPWSAVGVAFGLGLVFGLLLIRRP